MSKHKFEKLKEYDWYVLTALAFSPQNFYKIAKNAGGGYCKTDASLRRLRRHDLVEYLRKYKQQGFSQLTKRGVELLRSRINLIDLRNPHCGSARSDADL